MIKVRADLFREFQEEKTEHWEVERAIRECEDMASDDEAPQSLESAANEPALSSNAFPSSKAPSSLSTLYPFFFLVNFFTCIF